MSGVAGGGGCGMGDHREGGGSRREGRGKGWIMKVGKAWGRREGEGEEGKRG